MRRRLCASLAATLVLLAMVPAGAAPAPPALAVDGAPLALVPPARLEAGRLLVPVRPVAAALGYAVHWDAGRRAATLTRGPRRLTLRVGQAWVEVREGDVHLQESLWTPVRLQAGALYVPLRPFAAVATPGVRLHWDAAARRAALRRPGPPVAEPGAPDGTVPQPPVAGAPPVGEPPPAPATPPLRVLSYYTEEEPATLPLGAYATLTRQAPRISAVAAFFSRLQVDAAGDATGYLEPVAPAPYEVRRRVVETARRQGIPVYLLFHNLLYGRPDVGRRAASQVLNDERLRATLIDHVRAILAAEGYDGVNVDLEGIAPEDRDAYTRFVAELVAALRPHGYAVTLSVPAKTSDAPDHAWSYPYDYRALGQLADAVALMTYDYHGHHTGPGPLAPLDWVEQVARYAAATMPRQRIYLGLAGYAFDWPADGGRPRYLAAHEALARARALGVPVHEDPTRGAHYRYRDGAGRPREVWFETASTLAAKVELARDLGLGGVALWRAGLEDPRFWEWLAAERVAVARLPLRR